MLDKKNLSKIKYIYRIYESSDGFLHCERYPVVYINSEVVYFKDARKQEYLNYMLAKHVEDNFTKFYHSGYNGWYGNFNEYFWNIETNIEEIYEDLKKQRAIERNKYELESTKNKAERAKREYEDALMKIKLLEGLDKDKEK